MEKDKSVLVIVGALLAAALASLAWRRSVDIEGSVLVMEIVLVGVIVLVAIAAGVEVRRASKLRKAATNIEARKKAFRCRSLSEISFSLGEPESPFLRASVQHLDWLEEKVSMIYHVVQETNGHSVNLKEPLRKLRSMLQPLETEHWRLREPMDDVMLCRFLVASNFDSDKSFALAKKYLKYRADLDGGVRPPSSWTAAGCVIVPFEDTLGRPVIVVRAKYLDAYMDLDVFRAGYRATVDAIIAHLLHKRSASFSGSNPLEQYVILFESEGIGFGNFSPQIVQLMVKESNNHYPERLALINVLNSAHFVHSCFQLISPMLHPRTRKKIHFVTSDKVIGVMQKLVELDKLPPEYGGQAPSWATPAAARTGRDRYGALMAASYRRLGLLSPTEIEEEQEAEEESSHERISDDIPRSSGAIDGGCCGWR